MTTGSAHRSSLLIALGAILFTIGLFTGFAIPAFLNPRMGLTAHLEGVMNGVFLLAIGAVWTRVRLPQRAEAAAFWLLVYGSFANWASVLLAAVFGTSGGTPIAGAGFSGAPWQETLVLVGLLSVGLSMVLGMLLTTWGLLSGIRAATPRAVADA
jgi:(hydroxyamino)benzene mutase